MQHRVSPKMACTTRTYTASVGMYQRCCNRSSRCASSTMAISNVLLLVTYPSARYLCPSSLALIKVASLHVWCEHCPPLSDSTTPRKRESPLCQRPCSMLCNDLARKKACRFSTSENVQNITCRECLA
ncbi:hypothetical protein NPIL_648061 [Nephila pilipes]|uniref:Uncharacterized protein n=1 Tax=Nephila pilipes TaxID=299642 RepID=A0A8X6QZQ9_NEPPI|nr:hypothetical protein NPIL_648061 [Nephila pilipes]